MRATATATALALALACALTGCTHPPATKDTLPARLAAIRASCLVVVLDAASAQHFGTYGYPKQTTPNIDVLASQGVVFEHAYATGASTIVSVPSLLSGLYPQALVREHAKASRRLDMTRGIGDMLWQWRHHAPENTPLLAMTFQQAGFRTAAFSENDYVSPSFGLGHGFDHFVEMRGTAAGRDESALLVDTALAWLARQGDARTFVYLHLLRPHNPYSPPPAIAESFRPTGYDGAIAADTETLSRVDRGLQTLRAEDVAFVRSQYDANLFYADSLVGDLVRGLEARRLDERTVVVVTADHGEAFGQHERFLHNSTVYDEMVRVPLVWVFPPAAGITPRRVPTAVSLVDVAPTVRALFSVGDPSQATDGTSVVATFVGGEMPSRPVYVQALNRVGVVLDGYKYIGETTSTPGSNEELYWLARDPAELHNIGRTDPVRSTLLRQTVRTYVGERPVEVGVGPAMRRATPDVVDRLRALGYVAEDAPR